MILPRGPREGLPARRAGRAGGSLLFILSRICVFCCVTRTPPHSATRAQMASIARSRPVAAMPRRIAWLLLLAVAFADEADDTRVTAAADHLRAGELKELLAKAGVEFGCAYTPQPHHHGMSAMFSRVSHCLPWARCAGTARRRRS